MSVQEQFGVGDKTNRNKLLNFLSANKNKESSIVDAAKSVYGSRATVKAVPKLNLVINSLRGIIEKRSLPLEIRRENGTIGLFDKKAKRAKKR